MNGGILEFQYMTTVVAPCSQFTSNICEFNFMRSVKKKKNVGSREKNNNLNLGWLHP